MPTLRNHRHERFAQLLANGKNATDAYEEAGYKRSHSNGPALAKTEAISARVAQISAETLERERATAKAAAERLTITKQLLIESLLEARKGALHAHQYSAFVNATKEIAILAGLRIERSERGQPGEFDWISKLTVEELQQLADGKLDITSYQQGGDRQLN
jgi:phage terminase small subunit